MPTYQYACTACDHAFEQLQSFTEDSLTTCPQCQGRLRKIFNAVGVVFKGSGFYRTDSRADSKSSSTTAASTSDSGSTSTSSTAGSSSGGSATPAPATAGATGGSAA